MLESCWEVFFNFIRISGIFWHPFDPHRTRERDQSHIVSALNQIMKINRNIPKGQQLTCSKTTDLANRRFICKDVLEVERDVFPNTRHEGVWGGSIAPLVFNLGIKWRGVVCFTLRPLYRKKSPPPPPGAQKDVLSKEWFYVN